MSASGFPNRQLYVTMVRGVDSSGGLPVAEVTVFVDDAVLGLLPSICVKDGTYTEDRLKLRQELWNRSGLGIAWLLLLAGPVGWLGLIVIGSMRRSGGDLTVTLPFSESAHERLVGARRDRWSLAAVTIGVALLNLSRSTDHPRSSICENCCWSCRRGNRFRCVLRVDGGECAIP